VRLVQIGLTGGIGSGKSTAARRFAELGALVVDSDVIAREVVEPGTEGLAAVVAEFGDRVVRDGRLDRPALARIVFGDEEARGRLNAIVHPLVRARVAELIGAAAPGTVVVQDIPLLVESGQAGRFDLVVVVRTDVDTRLARLAERGVEPAQARARMAAQATDEQRAAVADVVLTNDGTPDELSAQVDRLWADLVRPG
jgi:dephospho-CoA kinase